MRGAARIPKCRVRRVGGRKMRASKAHLAAAVSPADSASHVAARAVPKRPKHDEEPASERAGASRPASQCRRDFKMPGRVSRESGVAAEARASRVSSLATGLAAGQTGSHPAARAMDSSVCGVVGHSEVDGIFHPIHHLHQKQGPGIGFRAERGEEANGVFKMLERVDHREKSERTGDGFHSAGMERAKSRDFFQIGGGARIPLQRLGAPEWKFSRERVKEPAEAAADLEKIAALRNGSRGGEPIEKHLRTGFEAMRRGHFLLEPARGGVAFVGIVDPGNPAAPGGIDRDLNHPAIRALEKLNNKRGRLAIRGHAVRESFDCGRLGTTADMAKRVAEIHFNSDSEELTREDTESE